MPTLDQLEAALRAADAAGNHEDAARLAQAYAAQRQAQGQPQAAPPEPSLGDQLARSTAMTARNVARGVASVPDIIIGPVAYLYNKAADSLGASPSWHMPTTVENVDRGMSAAGVPDYQPENGAEHFAGAVSRGLGGLVGGVGVGAGLAGAQSPLVGAVGQGLMSSPGAQLAAVTSGSVGSEVGRQLGLSPAAQVGLGLVGGALPAATAAGSQGAIAAARGAIASPSPEIVALAEKAAAQGIPLKASQISDSTPLKVLDSVTSKIPLSGAKGFQNQQQEAFNRAVARTIGEDSTKITPEVFARARDRIGGEFDRLTANNSVPINSELMDKFRGVMQEAAANGGPDAASMVSAHVNRLINQSVNGVIPGRVLQSVDSSIGKALRSGGEKTVYLGDLQETIRDAIQQNIRPEDVQAWAQARQQWRDLKTIEPLVASSTTGDIPAAQLMGRVTANNSGKGSMARGSRGDLGDLAQVGKQFLRDPVPDSGTAGRLLTMDALKGLGNVFGGALGAGTVINPLAGLATAGSLLAGSRVAQNVLRNQALVGAMLGKPQEAANAILRGIETSVNPTTAVLTQRDR
jgi:hypothetical protein